MNILYIIGNGFDINLGLKTAYQDFYNWYVNRSTDSEVIEKMKYDLSIHRYTTWADMELGLGAYTKNLNTIEELEEICHDISLELRQYLTGIQSSFEATPVIRARFIQQLCSPHSFLSGGNARAISRFLGQARDTLNYNIMSFNYTNCIESLFATDGKISFPIPIAQGHYLHSLHHIHQTLSNQDIITGVNDDGQIANAELLCDDCRDLLVKPHILNQLRTLVDEECTRLIDEADLFVLFGVSLGESDSIWWERIGKRMTHSTALLIYFAYDNDNPRFSNELIRKTRYYTSLMMNRCKVVQEKGIPAVAERLFIGYKTQFFKLK